MEDPTAAASVLDLPSESLLALMSLCDTCTLSNVAQAHSKLRQPAALVISKRSWNRPLTQQQINSRVLWLTNHSELVSKLHLSGRSTYRSAVSLRELPAQLQLDSLSLHELHIQLQAGVGFAGVLHPGDPLKQLQLHDCMLQYGEDGLEAAFAQLPQLQDLSTARLEAMGMDRTQFPGELLLSVPLLTRLELVYAYDVLPCCSALQHLPSLTALQDLTIEITCSADNEDEEDDSAGIKISASMLQPLQQLTSLQLYLAGAAFEPAALSGKTLLQKLHLFDAVITGGAAGVSALLHELQQLQELSVLGLSNTLKHCVPDASCYAALTASTGLSSLNLRSCMLPQGVWQHILREGVKLPLLQELFVQYVSEGGHLTTANVQRLVAAAPALWQLSSSQPQTPALLAPLTNLTGLQVLELSKVDDAGAGVLVQITGLRKLQLWGPSMVTEAGLLRLTALQQLSNLMLYSLALKGWKDTLHFNSAPQVRTLFTQHVD
jgi:hypothetical protein